MVAKIKTHKDLAQRIPGANDRGFAKNTLALAIASSLSLGAQAQEAESEAPVLTMEPLTVEYRPEQLAGPKYSRDLLNTPRIATVLSQDLLEDQNVTEMREAMRNVSGISLQAGEGNPPDGDQLKIRGFNARDDINVNGSRDLGNYFRDPFYVEQIEVIKGPNSAFSGRGSAGGTVNFVTKRPSLEDHNRLHLSGGSDEYVRATMDVNKAIDNNSAFRINLMSHSQDVPGRDVVNQRRQGVYAAYTWGLTGDTQVELDYLNTRQNNIGDRGLPFDREGYSGDRAPCDDANDNRVGRTGSQRCGDGFYTGDLPPGIDYSNFYGHVDDYQKIDVDQLGLAVQHQVSDAFSIRNQLRLGRVYNDSIGSSPRIKVEEEHWGSGDFSVARVQGDTKPRDQTDDSVINQTDLLFSFNTGAVEHDLVLGAELAQIDIENIRRPDVKGPRTDLYDPSPRTRPENPYDGTTHALELDQKAVYLLDTMALTQNFDLHVGLRWDDVEATAIDTGWDDPIGPISRSDSELSYSIGAVYTLAPNGTVYASYGTSFDITGTFDRGLVQLAGGASALDADGNRIPGAREDIVDLDAFNTDPEETRAFELGTKWELADNLSVNAALFQTEKTNARTPAIGGGDLLDVLDGEQRVRGFEVNGVGTIQPGWELYASYTYLADAEVVESNNAWEVGERLGGTPEHTFNVFTMFDVTPRFGIGGGMEYVSSQVNNVVPQEGARRRQVEIDDYSVFYAAARYRLTDNAQIRLNAFNLTNEEYISQLAEGGAQGIPGAGRQIVASLRYDF